METLISKSKVEELLPQKNPFVMVNYLLEFTDTSVVTGYEVSENNIFIENNHFNESGLIENIAQSIALHTNYQFYLNNEKAPAGYIGSVKNVVLNRLPSVGESIRTRVEILQEFMGVTLVKGVIQCGEDILMTAQMKTVLSE